MGGERDLLGDKRAPYLEHHLPRRCHLKQRRHGDEIHRDEDGLQGENAASLKPVREREDQPSDKGTGCRQVQVVNFARDLPVPLGNLGFGEEGLRCDTVGVPAAAKRYPSQR